MNEAQVLTGGRPVNPALMSKRILIVDDSADVRNSVSTFLKSKGYEISEAVDGVDAIEKAKKLQPDLVVMDARMPSLNGVEAASIIKRELRPRVRIILLTQYGHLLGKSVVSASGIDIILNKSDGLGTLLESVEKLLQRT
jgi:chemosensory pili system protein ChpA (sensor histidine kinase/response regulator)